MLVTYLSERSPKTNHFRFGIYSSMLARNMFMYACVRMLCSLTIRMHAGIMCHMLNIPSEVEEDWDAE